MNVLKSIFVALTMIAAIPSFAQFSTGGNFSNDDTASTIRTGYKGFIDLGYGIGVGDFGEDRLEISTAHGYQINTYFFAGAGLGLNYFHDASAYGIPIFADFRGSYPISNSKIAPFFDFKIGYSVGDAEGFYCSPSVGIRIAASEKCGINIGLGYEIQKVDAFWITSSYDIFKTKENTGAFTIKLGLDF